MTWQRGFEQEIADEFGELGGALGWKDFESMRFFRRALEIKPRVKVTDEQLRRMRIEYRRRWWAKLRADVVRYSRHRARNRRWRRRWLRALSPIAWRAYRIRAGIYSARYLARIRARPDGWQMFLAHRRELARARKALLARDSVAAARSLARRRWLAARLRHLRRALASAA